MNKYQEALNKVYELISDLDFGSQLKCAEQLKIIQELVDKTTPLLDKETPKKVLNKHKEYFYYDEEQPFPDSKITGICPVCNHSVEQDKYCNRCGQKLDWSD